MLKHEVQFMETIAQDWNCRTGDVVVAAAAELRAISESRPACEAELGWQATSSAAHAAGSFPLLVAPLRGVKGKGGLRPLPRTIG